MKSIPSIPEFFDPDSLTKHSLSSDWVLFSGQLLVWYFTKDSKNLIVVPDSSPPKAAKTVKFSESFLKCQTKSRPEKVKHLRATNGFSF
jgi:hypothetical protein